ncbi:Receptor-like protein 45 [Cardamine amara subsp. amara]|uniref:Receptor-like protein 45 n=1 Tax=Cardamine amara subsp. amara TaxID=228776 RepID=A0ABD1BX62_CARAN
MSSTKSMVFVLTWMILMMMQGCISCIESERQGLLDLKAYLISVSTDPHLNILQGWSSGNHSCCSWRRVKCNVTSKHVIGLSLGSLDDSDSPQGG